MVDVLVIWKLGWCSLVNDDMRRFVEGGGQFVDDLLGEVDVVLDAAPGGIGAKNKQLYAKFDRPAIFQGGDKGAVADVFFHGYANYEKGLGKKYLLLTSCNTTGLIRTVDCLDRAFGIEKIAVTIIRRCADLGDTHRGYVDLWSGPLCLRTFFQVLNLWFR